MRFSHRKILLVVAWVFFLCAATAQAQEGSPGALTLEKALRIVTETNPEVVEARLGIDIARTRLDEALGYKRPQVSLTAFVAPAARARGKPLDSPDSSDRVYGITDWERADLLITEPLYTFRKIANYAKAATHGIEVEKAKVMQKKGEVVLKTIEYYNGYLLAKELHALVIEIKDVMDDAKTKLSRMLERDTGEASEIDSFKLNAYYGLVEKNLFKILKSIEVAKDAVKMMVGIPKGEEVDIEESRLEPVEYDLDTLSSYQTRAEDQRPEFIQIEEGLKAKEALVEAHKAERWPDIFAAGVASASNSSGRERHDDPFIADEFNHMYGTIMLGLRWNIDFGITQAKIDRAAAEKKQLQATQKHADAGIPVQIAKAWQEAVEYRKDIESLEAAYKNGKKWMVAASSNFDIGLGEAEEIFKAMTIYGMVKADYYQAIYDYNLAVASLLHFSGEDVAKYSTSERGGDNA